MVAGWYLMIELPHLACAAGPEATQELANVRMLWKGVVGKHANVEALFLGRRLIRSMPAFGRYGGESGRKAL